MKLKLLLMMFLAVIALQSCQSEYGERMHKALELKRKYQQVKANLTAVTDPTVVLELDDIKKEINFHATLSGNENLFLQQIWSK